MEFIFLQKNLFKLTKLGTQVVYIEISIRVEKIEEIAKKEEKKKKRYKI